MTLLKEWKHLQKNFGFTAESCHTELISSV